MTAKWASSVIVGRWLLLLLPAAALVWGVICTRAKDRAALVSTAVYTCPMHPEVRAGAPGDCPVCNMALVPLRGTEHPTSNITGGRQVVATVEERMVARPLRAAASLGADGQGIAILYRDDLVGLMPEEPARFLGSRSPTLPVDAHLMTSQQVPVDSSTVSVRFRLDQPRGHEDGASASAMEVGSLQVDVRARKLLVVPTSAVLYSAGPAGHAYVLASAGEGEPFTKRPVEVGRILDSGYLGAFAGRQDGATVILSGLREAERVIGGYAFFSDVERRLRERTGGVMP